MIILSKIRVYKKNGSEKKKNRYLVREERYITDQEAKEMNYVDPMNKKPLQREKETNYLFKLSKYAPLIKKKLEDEPDWCRPEQYLFFL